MVQESFKALKNTNINPLITSYKTAPSPRAVFLSLHFAKGARCDPHGRLWGASRTGKKLWQS